MLLRFRPSNDTEATTSSPVAQAADVEPVQMRILRHREPKQPPSTLVESHGSLVTPLPIMAWDSDVALVWRG